jgi:hypothetical protein
MILLAAEGLNNDQIAERLDSRREVVDRSARAFLRRSAPRIRGANASGLSL